MRFYAFDIEDPPEMIDLAVPDELIDMPSGMLAEWCDAFIANAVEHLNMHVRRPLGVAGGRLADDQDPREWPNLPDEWAIVNAALAQATRRYIGAHTG